MEENENHGQRNFLKSWLSTDTPCHRKGLRVPRRLHRAARMCLMTSRWTPYTSNYSDSIATIRSNHSLGGVASHQSCLRESQLASESTLIRACPFRRQTYISHIQAGEMPWKKRGSDQMRAWRSQLSKLLKNTFAKRRSKRRWTKGGRVQAVKRINTGSNIKASLVKALKCYTILKALRVALYHILEKNRLNYWHHRPLWTLWLPQSSLTLTSSPRDSSFRSVQMDHFSITNSRKKGLVKRSLLFYHPGPRKL